MMKKERFLITSDDGWTDGTKILLEMLLEQGCDAYAIVPEHRMSLCGKTLTIHKALRINHLETTSLPVYTINGSPADAVAFATSGIEFEKPTVVLCGVNAGENVSVHGMLGSGTTGGAIEGAFAGLKAYAISYAIPYAKANEYILKSWKEREIMKKIIYRIIEKTIAYFEPYEFLNINLPYPLTSENVNIEITKAIPKFYLASFEKRIDPSGRPYYWYIAKKAKGKSDEDAYVLFEKHNISITPVCLVSMEDEKRYKRWKNSIMGKVLSGP